MAKKNKHLCKWEKEERMAKLGRYRAMVKKPRFVCENCGRVAKKKKWLCKPFALAKKARA